MSKHTKGNGAEDASSVIVVTPDNIGKGIKWNESTGKYDVSIAAGQPIRINDKNELEVQLSKVGNNQLRVMNDGLYLGKGSRPELANLYVDAVNGVDQDPLKVSGAGSRSKPLKTLVYAVRVVENGTASSIFLHEDQEHVVSASDPLVYKNDVILNIGAYGSRIDAQKASNGNNTYLANLGAAINGYAPKLVFKSHRIIAYRPATNWYDRVELQTFIFDDCNVSFGGIHFINDLGFTAAVTCDSSFNHTTTSPNYVTHPFRIELQGNSVMSIQCSRVSSRGTPRLTGPLANGTDDSIKFLQYQKAYSNKWNSSIVHSNSATTMVVREIYGLDDLQCYVIGSNGWGPAIGANFLLNNSGGMHPSVEALTARVANYSSATQQPSGDKIILAPVSNIDASKWASWK